MENNQEVLVQVKHLKQYFNQGKRNEVRAINDISFDIFKGETFGLVGESGCGKSTTGKAIIKLNDITSGDIFYDGTNIKNIKSRKQSLKFNKRIQMIFQDPYASLNPRLKVMDIIAEGIDIHKLATSRKDRKRRVYDLLETVGLNKEHANRYPHEFSGGQRQRIGIARALAVEPEFIIADEPISALDVSIQAQVVNLLLKLQRERNITFLFIAHDLSMVKYISDRIAVMHFGKIVEIGKAEDIYNHPLHAYTQSLLSAVPQPDPESERTRTRMTYKEDGKDGERQLNEIEDGHYVFTTDAEAAELRKHINTREDKGGTQMKFKCTKIVGTLIAAAFVLSGCGKGSGLYDDKGQVYRSTLSQDMSTLDNVMASDNVSFRMFTQVYEGLYVLDKNDKAIPGVAKGEPKISKDEKRYTIDLRHDAKWSNGDPVTANDFVYSWRKAVDPKTGSEYAFIMNYLKNAEDVNSGKSQ